MICSFKQNWKLYLMEAAGLAFFMFSACLFGGLLWSDHSALDHWVKTNNAKFIIMGTMMGFTALGIFYSPWTNKSGAQINPAVTLTFYRLGRMRKWDVIFYILFQFIGGTLAVYGMKVLMGNLLTDPAVNYVVTIPQGVGNFPAAVAEFCTALIMMMMVLFTSAHEKLSKFTRIFAAILVCLYINIAGPVSGFGMNPARTFASALPAHTWTSLWIYIIMPVAGMFTAAEIYLSLQHQLKSFKCFHLPSLNSSSEKMLQS